MTRLLPVFVLLLAGVLRAQAEPLPDPNDSKGWVNASSRADVLNLPADTRHLHGYRMDDAALESLKRFKGLQSLTLEGEYTDAGVKHLAELKTLRNLQIDCTNLSDAACTPIGKLAELEWLGLERCVKITDRGLRELAGLKKVTWLILHGDHWDDFGRRENQGITDAGLKQLAGMTAMKRLDLGSLRNAGDALAELGPRMKDLEELTLSYCGKAGENAFKGLAKCNNLRLVMLLGLAAVNEPVTRQLAGLKGLQELSLSMCEGLDDAALGALGKSKSLKALQYQGRVAFGDAGLAELAKCRSLSRLSIAHVEASGGLDMGDDGDFEEGTPRPPRQPAKPAPKAKFSDAAFKALAKAEGLRLLILENLEAATDTALLGLVDAPLVHLALNACPNVSDKGLQVIGKMKTLRHLSLAVDGSMPAPPGMERGKKMRITNEGLRHLAGLENLAELNLSGQAVTDAGMEHLKALSALRRLVLAGVGGVSESGESALRAALPELVIDRGNGDEPPPD